MASLVGLVHLDGEPRAVAALREASESAPNFRRTFAYQISRYAAFASSPRGDSLTRLTGPAATHPDLLIAQGRLDNRAELVGELGSCGVTGSYADDAALIKMAYLKWGNSCAVRLHGDWSLAAWSDQQRRLFVARDPIGCSALFYCRFAGRFAFASDLPTLLSFKGVPRRLREIFVAQVLTGWLDDHGFRTAYEGVYRLPPGNYVVVTPAGCSQVAYSQPFMPLEGSHRQGGPAELAEMMREAVRVRLPEKNLAAASLSGGLDSGSITALAAEVLLGEGRPLVALTAVPAHPLESWSFGQHGDESGLSAVVAARFPNVRHVLVTAAGVDPVAALRDAVHNHAQPMFSAGNVFWIAAMLARARDEGATSIMTGQGGNSGVSWTGPAQTSTLRMSRLVRLGVSRALPARVRSWVRRPTWRSPGLLDAPWRGYSAIGHQFATELDLAGQMADAGHDPWFDAPPRLFSDIRPESNTTNAAWAVNCEVFGIRPTDPTLDTRVLRCILDSPFDAWRGPMDRWLFRSAMEGILPDVVRLNRHRGRQAADLVPRLRQFSSSLDAALEDAGASPLARRCVDLEYIRAAQRRLADPPSRRQRLEAGAVILRGISATMFLRDVERAGAGG